MRAAGETACPALAAQPRVARCSVDLNKDGGKSQRKNTDGWRAGWKEWQGKWKMQVDGAKLVDTTSEPT